VYLCRPVLEQELEAPGRDLLPAAPARAHQPRGLEHALPGLPDLGLLGPNQILEVLVPPVWGAQVLTLGNGCKPQALHLIHSRCSSCGVVNANTPYELANCSKSLAPNIALAQPHLAFRTLKKVYVKPKNLAQPHLNRFANGCTVMGLCMGCSRRGRHRRCPRRSIPIGPKRAYHFWEYSSSLSTVVGLPSTVDSGIPHFSPLSAFCRDLANLHGARGGEGGSFGRLVY
jgi:ferredoxin